MSMLKVAAKARRNAILNRINARTIPISAKETDTTEIIREMRKERCI